MRSAAPRSALEVRGLDVYYGHSHALQGVDLSLDAGVFSVVGRNGMGKTTLCKAIMGLVPASGGSIRVRGKDITAAASRAYRAARRRLCAAGPAAVALAQRRRASAAGRRDAARRLDRRAHLRHVSAARRTQGSWRRPAVRRRAADARDLARAADQPAAPDHGRADRRAGARHRRPGRGDAAAAWRGRRHGGARDRAEHRRRDRDLAQCRDHGQWPHQPHHRLRRLSADRELQQRLLGVGCTPSRTGHRVAGRGGEAKPVPRGTPQRRRSGSTSPIPTLPTRWSQPVPIERIEAAARTLSTQVARLDETARRKARAARR